MDNFINKNFGTFKLQMRQKFLNAVFAKAFLNKKAFSFYGEAKVFFS